MKIAIVGFGVEGRENLEFFHNEFPGAEFTIFDEKEPQNVPDFAKIESGADTFSRIKNFDLVLRSPSIAPKKIPAENKEVSSSTNWFFVHCPAPIVGVTGSKGKGTTCSFVAKILEKYFARENARTGANRRVFLVGNIGVPALKKLAEITPNDAVVYELSSFQLWDARKSPHVAVFTLLEPDHLDVHENFDEYARAKGNIFAYQTADDFAIFDPNDEKISELAAKSPAKKLHFPDEKLAKLAQNNLPGEHNVRNAEAAILAARALFSDIRDEEIHAGLTEFDGLPHRLKFVREIAGAKYYDDSIATTPGSAIAAIKSFAAPKILILGGHDKGSDYGVLGEEIAKINHELPNGKVKLIFTVGANRDKIARQIAEKSDVEIIKIDTDEIQKKFAASHDPTGNFDDILREVSARAELGDVVILSPASASFDMFKSYSDRGEQFVKSLEKLAK